MKYVRLSNDDPTADKEDFIIHKSPKRQPLWAILVISSLLCNVLLLIWIFLPQKLPPRLVYSPAHEAAVLELRAEHWDLTLGQPSAYTASAGPEVDALWDEISAPPGKVGFIKVQKDEMDKIDDYTVPFADGSGYLVTVDVFHQLHCLDYLRKQLFPTPGAPEEDADGKDMTMYHKAHCVDSLRRYIQCHADTSLLTMKYIEGYSYPWPDFRTTHQCYNWERILAWAQSRMVNVSGMFVHPHLGPAEAGPQDNPIAGGKRVRWLPADA